MRSLWFVVLAALFLNSQGADYFPPYITQCSLNDVKVDECVWKQIEITLPIFAKGIPELNVPSLDPVDLNDIHIKGNGLNLDFTEATMHGLSKTHVSDLKIDIPKEQFTLAIKGNMSVKAKYKIDGRILILPIQGEGDAIVRAEGLDVVIRSQLKRFTDANGEHFRLVSPSYSYKMDRTVFKFENLFGGNNQLADATHQFANNNWQQIMDDLAPPVVKQIVKTCVKAINKFFAATNTNQIFKDQ